MILEVVKVVKYLVFFSYKVLCFVSRFCILLVCLVLVVVWGGFYFLKIYYGDGVEFNII